MSKWFLLLYTFTIIVQSLLHFLFGVPVLVLTIFKESVASLINNLINKRYRKHPTLIRRQFQT